MDRPAAPTHMLKFLIGVCPRESAARAVGLIAAIARRDDWVHLYTHGFNTTPLQVCADVKGEWHWSNFGCICPSLAHSAHAMRRICFALCLPHLLCTVPATLCLHSDLRLSSCFTLSSAAAVVAQRG